MPIQIFDCAKKVLQKFLLYSQRNFETKFFKFVLKRAHLVSDELSVDMIVVSSEWSLTGHVLLRLL